MDGMRRIQLARAAVMLATFGLLATHMVPAASSAQRPWSAGSAGFYRFDGPLGIAPNMGQAPTDVLYHAAGGPATVAFLRDAVEVHAAGTGEPVLRIEMTGSRGGPDGVSLLPGRLNFLLGDDPAAWRTGVPAFTAVTYPAVAGGAGITFRVRHGSLEATVDQGSRADTSAPLWRLSGPAASQAGGNAPHLAPGSAVVNFDFSTYLGGSLVDRARGVAVDSTGATLVAGSTASTNFPVDDPFQPGMGSSGGTFDVFVTKVNAAGDAWEWSTFLGGSGEDGGYGLAVGPSDRVYVTGSTQSADFPVVAAWQAANAQRGKSDAFVAVLESAGDALHYSTYYGGTGFDPAFAITVDAAGSAYIAGYTDSPDLPTRRAPQSARRGSSDAYVAKFSPAGDDLLVATYIGGLGFEEARGLAVAGDDVHIVGITDSVNFPAENAAQRTRGGGMDGFVMKLGTAVDPMDPAAPATVAYATYLGGNQTDEALGVALLPDGAAAVVGVTSSTGFPTANAFQSSKRSGSDAFVTVLEPTGDTLRFSSFLGGNGDDAAKGVAIRDGRLVVVGGTASPNFPTLNALQPAVAGGVDAFAVVIDLTASAALVFGTTFGGSGTDLANAVADAGARGIVVTGETDSPQFPTERPIQSARGGSFDAFIARIGPDTVPTPGPSPTPGGSTATATPVAPSPTSPSSTPTDPGDTPTPSATAATATPTDTPVAPTETPTTIATATSTVVKVEVQIFLPWVDRP